MTRKPRNHVRIFIIVAERCLAASGNSLPVLADAIYEANRRKCSEKNMYSKVKMIVFDFGTESDSEVEVRNYQFKPALAGN